MAVDKRTKYAVIAVDGGRTSFGYRLDDAEKYSNATGGRVVYRSSGKFGGTKREYRWLDVK